MGFRFWVCNFIRFEGVAVIDAWRQDAEDIQGMGGPEAEGDDIRGLEW